MKPVEIYTDGSCNHKTRQGGIGVLIKFGEKTREISKGYTDTTIGRMELTAIIEALKTVKKQGFTYTIYSDSEYIINSINKGWLFNWQKQNFENRINSDLWKEFLDIYFQFSEKSLNFVHVKGHKGNVGNEIADMLANYKNFIQ